MSSLIPQHPNLQPPNFFLCDGAYGNNMVAEDCFAAANLLPVGRDPQAYNVNGGDRAIWNLPMLRRRGQCDLVWIQPGHVSNGYCGF